MKILVRNDKKEPWQLVESAAYRGEAELQHLLAESPSLVSIEDVCAGAGQLILAVREFPLPVGSLDLLAFSARGDLTLIECKLANNPDAKRKVMGQALDYGAHLWQMSYEELDRRIRDRAGKTLADLMHGAVDDAQWEEETFRQNVESALASGSFILMIVVDEITEELSRIVRFVNTCGLPAFSFAALEMRRFQSGKAEMLVPRVVGNNTSKEDSAGSNRKNWTEAVFREEANKLDPSTAHTISELLGWSQANADVVRFGTGKATGSFTFLVKYNEQEGSVFSVYTNGDIAINFGNMGKVFSSDQIESFRLEMISIQTFGKALNRVSNYPTLKIASAFPSQEHRERFQEAVLRVKNLLS